MDGILPSLWRWDDGGGRDIVVLIVFAQFTCMLYDPSDRENLGQEGRGVMRDTARQPVQPVQPVQHTDEREQTSQERRPSLPTPTQFYTKLVAREDIRAILKRLANN